MGSILDLTLAMVAKPAIWTLKWTGKMVKVPLNRLKGCFSGRSNGQKPHQRQQPSKLIFDLQNSFGIL